MGGAPSVGPISGGQSESFSATCSECFFLYVHGLRGDEVKMVFDPLSP